MRPPITGHDLRLIAPKVVKPQVKNRKNDMADAAAIVEAASRPTMRLVDVKTPAQQGRVRACGVTPGGHRAAWPGQAAWHRRKIAADVV